MDINLDDLFPPVLVKTEPQLEWVDVILTRAHPDVSRLVAHWSPVTEQLYIDFEERKRPLSLDPEEVESALTVFIQAIFNSEVSSLLDQGVLALRARAVLQGKGSQVL